MQRIAVLDDDEHWCHVIERFLRKDFEVVTFQEIQRFLTSSIESFDLVIIDFAIPPVNRYEQEMTGIEVINHLKERSGKMPKIVLTSAFISKSDPAIDSKLRSIADAILPKDLGLDAIQATLKQLLSSGDRG